MGSKVVNQDFAQINKSIPKYQITDLIFYN